ncbi:MAG: hypothetical protein AB1762_09345 [Gemmatimonadota bacterium]
MTDGSMTPHSTPEFVRRRVQIRYARPHSLYLRGPVTGTPYVFNPDAGTAVDAIDADALLETGLFVRA